MYSNKFVNKKRMKNLVTHLRLTDGETKERHTFSLRFTKFTNL